MAPTHPANAVAVLQPCLIGFVLCVLRIAAHLSGQALGLLELELGHDVARRKTDRQDYIPARVAQGGVLEPVEIHGSAHLAALLRADDFIVVPPGPKQLRAGTKARFIMLR